MPIYEYACKDCGTKFEKLVKSSDRNGITCPSCGREHVQQELSVFSSRSGGRRPETTPGGCPAGMCRTPDLCRRN